MARRRHTPEQVSVIFLSAYGQDDVVARAFDMGAADYVVKPYPATELAARIRAALRRKEMTEAARAATTLSAGRRREESPVHSHLASRRLLDG